MTITNRPLAPNKGREFPAEPLTPAEINALFAQISKKSVSGIRNRAMISMLYRSGLRVSELVALRPADVNLDKHSIRLLDTKSGKPQTRGFHASADDALMRWIDTRKGLGFKNGPLFCCLDGTPVSDDYIRVLLKRLASKAGIEKRCHPHGLRHTFSVEYIEAGGDIVSLSKLLGHSSIAVTARYIDHLTNGQAIEALQQIELPPLG